MSNNTQQQSNFTNITSSTQPDILFNNLIISSQVFVIFCVVVHFIYLILVIFLPDLRTRSLAFINHAIFANSLYPIGSLVFLYVDPNTMISRTPTLVSILCSCFEIFWPFSIYLRMYSILLIAMHRHLAVFRSDLFRRLNNSPLLITLTILSSWVMSLTLSFSIKYAFRTTYSLTNCLSGFSNVFINSLVSALLYVIFSLLLPTIAIVVIYIIISRRLNSLGDQLASKKAATRKKAAIIAVKSVTMLNGGLGSNVQMIRINNRKEMRFANQFILLCLLVVLTIMGIAVFSFRGVIPNYFAVMYYWRSVIRCYIMFFSAIVPILSFYYNPSRNQLFHHVKSHISSNLSWTDINNNSTTRTTNK